MRGYPDCQVVKTTENNKLTHNRDVIMGVTIALLVVSVAFNCAFTWNWFSMQNATDNSKSLETTSNRDTQEWASLRRIEAAVNAILAQRHYPSPRAMDSANMTDDVVCEFSHLYEGHFPDKKACDVPISSTTTSTTEEHDEQDVEKVETDEGTDWLLMSWVRWLVVWFYRLILVFLLGFVVFVIMTEYFQRHEGLPFIQTAVFIFVSYLGYFPHALMDVYGSHCTTWYFSICKAVARLLWLMAVCFVNIRIAKEKDILQYTKEYAIITVITNFVMYNGFYPERIFA